MSSPLRHRVHPDLGVVVTTWTGVASDAEMQASHAVLYASEAWRPGMHELVDLRAADLSGITQDGMRGLARIVERAMGGNGGAFRTAVVVSGDLEFGMARLYGGHQGEEVGSVRVFRCGGEALDWLGLEAWPPPEAGVPVTGG